MKGARRWFVGIVKVRLSRPAFSFPWRRSPTSFWISTVGLLLNAMAAALVESNPISPFLNLSARFISGNNGEWLEGALNDVGYAGEACVPRSPRRRSYRP